MHDKMYQICPKIGDLIIVYQTMMTYKICTLFAFFVIFYFDMQNGKQKIVCN